MNTDFLKLSADDRRIVLEQSALHRNLSPVILEKDFWFCWLLGVLFESEFAGSLVFKGGTALSKVFSDWRCEVIALGVERSFWGKATILHAEHHRPAGKPTPDRYSRHYADTAALVTSPTVIPAIDRHDILERVVEWKRRFFGSRWASYDTAKPGTLRLVPALARLRHLRQEYGAMRDMYLGEPVPFDDVMNTLSAIEAWVNGGSMA